MVCEKDTIRAVQPICLTFGASILEWCKNHNEEPQEFYSKIVSVEEFSSSLYQSLGHQQESKKDRWTLWHHANLDNLVELKTKEYRENIADWHSFKQCADEYLKRPWLHNSYMDWLFLDALACSVVLESYEFVQTRNLGMMYVLLNGNVWKTHLARLVWIPFVFFLGWVLPGLICWGISYWSPMVALGLGIIYYGYSLIVLLKHIAFHIGYRWNHKKSPKQELSERLMGMIAVYNRLKDETIHVPSLRQEIEDARKKGVVWPSQILCLVDNIEEKNKVTWSKNGPALLDKDVDIFEDDDVASVA